MNETLRMIDDEGSRRSLGPCEPLSWAHMQALREQRMTEHNRRANAARGAQQKERTDEQ